MKTGPLSQNCSRSVAAVIAGPAGIDHATDRGEIAFAKISYFTAHFHDAADDLMPGHARISGSAPFAARRVKIGMADAAEENVDLDVGRVPDRDARRKTARAEKFSNGPRSL